MRGHLPRFVQYLTAHQPYFLDLRSEARAALDGKRGEQPVAAG
ncbi:MAG TPA: hypothetical protein VFN46_08930 [Acetobacteraceae bacterium]|nr:hypothetical protein [Acetobacteraceae bacterium]